MGFQTDCLKCHRTALFNSENEYQESIQLGCSNCRAMPETKYPRYYPEYNSKLDKWRIIEENKITVVWFWCWPVDYLKTNILTRCVSNVDGAGHDADLPIEFDRRAKAVEYIRLMLSK